MVNVGEVNRLINKKFNGNISAFRRALSLNHTTVWRVLNGTSDGTKKFLPSLIRYCKKENLDYRNYII